MRYAEATSNLVRELRNFSGLGQAGLGQLRTEEVQKSKGVSLAAWWWWYEVLCDQDKSKKAAEGAERRGLEPALEDGAAAHSVDLGPTKSTVLRDTVLEWKGERVGRAETPYRRERAS